MQCINHKDREAASVCQVCGRALCSECSSHWDVAVCDECVKKESKKKILEAAAKLAIIIVGTLVISLFCYSGFNTYFSEALPISFMLMGIPFGWLGITKLLNSNGGFGLLLGPVFFILAAFFKLALSGLIGWAIEIYEMIVSVITIFKEGKKIKTANTFIENVAQMT